MLISELQLLKALEPMDFKPTGSVTPVRLEQRLNALSSMAVTPAGITIGPCFPAGHETSLWPSTLKRSPEMLM